MSETLTKNQVQEIAENAVTKSLESAQKMYENHYGQEQEAKDQEYDGGLTDNDLRKLLYNESILRQRVLRESLGSTRDIYRNCKLPQTQSITIDDYKEMYDRNPIGARVVEVMPRECWKVQPEIFEDPIAETHTEFENAIESLGKSLSFEEDSTFIPEDDSINPIWKILERADIESGIGNFGAIFFGFDDIQADENDPKPIEGLSTTTQKVFNAGLEKPVEGESNKLLFVRVLNEKMVKVSKYVQDMSDPRNGKPEFYEVNMFDADNEPNRGTVRQSQVWINVHWTRILHVAELNTSSEEFHIPRQRVVWNALVGLDKIVCSDGEGMWNGNFPGLSLESHPQLGPNVKWDIKDIRKQLADYSAGQQKWLTLSGAHVNQLTPNVGDPMSHFDMHIAVICIILAIPKRIFIGSERGELSSSQDADMWELTLCGRRKSYLTPYIIVPFIERLIKVGALPKPKEWHCVWPISENLSELDKSQMSLNLTQALIAYINGGGENMIRPEDFLIKILGVTDEEAESLIKAARQHIRGSEDDTSDEELVKASPPPTEVLIDPNTGDPKETDLPLDEFEEE